MKRKKLQIEQLQQKIQLLSNAEKISIPQIGWVKMIRTTFGMSLEQLAQKLNINKSSVARMETRESTGAITLGSMEKAGKALGMKFIYGFVPFDGSLEALIENKARKLAREIVMRTSGTMKLEDQENSPERIETAIKERTKEIIEEMPKILWD